MKHSIASLVVAGAALVLAGSALAAPRTASIAIRHQVRHCHTWSVNGGPWRASQVVHLAKGGAITIVNNDMMPHKLVALGGPSVALKNIVPAHALGLKGPFAPGLMGRFGSGVHVLFAKSGTYRFTTKPGEDYMPMKTIGEDNVLKLTVVVG